MKFSTVIAHLTKEYNRAKTDKTVRKPMSYALYHTWTWVDAYEKEKKNVNNDDRINKKLGEKMGSIEFRMFDASKPLANDIKRHCDEHPNCKECQYERYENCKLLYLYEKTKTDQKKRIMNVLADLYIIAEDINYAFDVNNWSLVFSVFARKFDITDTDVFEIVDKAKEE